MEWTIKAIGDTIALANANREDLSNTMYLTDGPERPLSTVMATTPATNTTHQWNEIGLNTAGRANVAGGGKTYAEAGLPNATQKSPGRKTNKTCAVGGMAEVSDREIAVFNGGGRPLNLAEGEMERIVQDALDFAIALVTVEVLNQIEWMHLSGDSSNATMEGGETDGLLKWATAGGYNVATGGTVTTAVAMLEQFIKDGARGAALTMPTLHPDTVLISPELVPDINSYVANGAGRPIVINANGTNAGLVGGHQVGIYNDGYAALEVKPEPYLSPAYNSGVQVNCAFIAYRKSQVKHAELIKLGVKPLAYTTTALQRLVNAEFAQEHSVAKHTYVGLNLKSNIA